MAKYIKQEVPDFAGNGESKVYYRLQRELHFTGDEFVKWICKSHTGNEGVVLSVLQQVGEGLADLLGHGHAVTIDGIGTFHAAIGVKQGKEVDSLVEGESERNAQSLQVTGVNFRADKKLVGKTNQWCRLERGGTRRLRRIQSTRDERLQLALGYLDTHGMMRLADYVTLTGLSRTAASLELKEFRLDPSTGITFKGRGTHKVYVRRKED